MDYLITGATGFIGKHLVDSLLSSGDTVNYLGRKRSPTLDSRAAFHCWNPGQPAPLGSVPTLDAIVNLAGEPVAQRWTPEVKRRIDSSRVEGTRKLVSAIGNLRHRPAVLVSASAVGYYGDRGDEVLTESSAPGTDFLADVCVNWEREALRAREFGVRVVVIRIGVVLGREGGVLKKMLTPFRLGVGGKLGNGRQWMPLIHVADLVRLLIFAAGTSSATGPLNGSSPQPVTNAEFTKALAATLHRPALLPMPKFALKLAMGEFAGSVFSSSRAIPEATQRAGFSFEFSDVATALRNVLQRPEMLS